jgi:signal transduction histidine kinase
VNTSSTWLHRSIYYLAASLMFAAAALRSILIYQDSPLFDPILLLLAGWLITFIVSSLVANKSRWLLGFLIGIEVIITMALLLITRTDYFSLLFAIPGMQAAQETSFRVALILIGFFSILTFLSLFQPYGTFIAIAMSVVFFGGSLLLVIYIGSTRRARAIQDRQQALVYELQQANQQLAFYSQHVQQLAAGRERQRLARELHDSVTQTIFSMTLTTQSALLLLERDRKLAADQLERLSYLAQSTLSEMQTLILRLAPEKIAQGGFIAALQQHLVERQRMDNLTVSFVVQGSLPLSPLEEQSLFRIAQEALNNVAKHAGVSQAVLQLHLAEPFSMTIEDQGAGFDLQQIQGDGRLGMVSMRERAAEIGWNLQVDTSPGNGTRIIVQKLQEESDRNELSR